jgi:hypothetical protein
VRTTFRRFRRVAVAVAVEVGRRGERYMGEPGLSWKYRWHSGDRIACLDHEAVFGHPDLRSTVAPAADRAGRDCTFAQAISSTCDEESDQGRGALTFTGHL